MIARCLFPLAEPLNETIDDLLCQRFLLLYQEPISRATVSSDLIMRGSRTRTQNQSVVDQLQNAP